MAFRNWGKFQIWQQPEMKVTTDRTFKFRFCWFKQGIVRRAIRRIMLIFCPINATDCKIKSLTETPNTGAILSITSVMRMLIAMPNATFFVFCLRKSVCFFSFRRQRLLLSLFSLQVSKYNSGIPEIFPGQYVPYPPTWTRIFHQFKNFWYDH